MSLVQIKIIDDMTMDDVTDIDMTMDNYKRKMSLYVEWDELDPEQIAKLLMPVVSNKLVKYQTHLGSIVDDVISQYADEMACDDTVIQAKVTLMETLEEYTCSSLCLSVEEEKDLVSSLI